MHLMLVWVFYTVKFFVLLNLIIQLGAVNGALYFYMDACGSIYTILIHKCNYLFGLVVW